MTSLPQNDETVRSEKVQPLTAGPVSNVSSAGQQGVAPLSSTQDLTPVIKALSVVLRDGVDIHRCEAARALGKIGTGCAGGCDGDDVLRSLATDVLVESLLDEDEDVRTDAAEALQVIADPRSIEQLLANLIGDPCSEVKMAALKALTNMKAPEVVPWLKQLLRWHSEEIVWDEDEFYEGGWDSWVDLQIAAIKALADFGVADAIPEIVAAINEEDAQDLTEFAFEAFARMGGAGASALVDFLGDKDSRRRRRAAVTLAGIDHAAARAAVLHALKDPAKDVRLAIAEAISSQNFNDQICEILLSDKDAEIRAVAICHVDEGDTDQLISWLEDPASEVQLAVLSRLMKIRDFVASPELKTKLEALSVGEVPAISAIALEALATLFGDATANFIQDSLLDPSKSEEVRLGALRGLKKIASDEAVSAMAQTLILDERQLRFDAVAALGDIAASTAFPNLASTTLISALKGEITPMPEEPELAPNDEEAPVADEQVDEVAEDPELDPESGPESDVEVSEDEDEYPTSTWQAIMGNDGPTEGRMAELGESKKNRIRLTETDMEMLALSAQTPRKSRVKLAGVIPAYKDVPQFAARMLGQIAQFEVASALAQNIESGPEKVRLAALDSLVQIGETCGDLPKDALDALMRVVANAERDARLMAIRAIGVAKAKGCAGFLVHRFEDGDSFVKTEVINALSCMGVEIDQLDQLIADPERSVRLAAAAALMAEKGESALEQIVEFAFAYEGYLRREAAHMLREIGPSLANPQIVSVLEDEDRRREWGVAIEVLAEINSPKLNQQI